MYIYIYMYVCVCHDSYGDSTPTLIWGFYHGSNGDSTMAQTGILPWLKRGFYQGSYGDSAHIPDQTPAAADSSRNALGLQVQPRGIDKAAPGGQQKRALVLRELGRGPSKQSHSRRKNLKCSWSPLSVEVTHYNIT